MEIRPWHLQFRLLLTWESLFSLPSRAALGCRLWTVHVLQGPKSLPGVHILGRLCAHCCGELTEADRLKEMNGIGKPS